MTVVAMVLVGAIVGIVAHLILGADGYAWFGEIIVGIASACVFGMIVGILSGAREVNATIVVSALVGAVIVEGIIILLTLRASRTTSEPAS